jgi:hypothetical protein
MPQLVFELCCAGCGNGAEVLRPLSLVLVFVFVLILVLVLVTLVAGIGTRNAAAGVGARIRQPVPAGDTAAADLRRPHGRGNDTDSQVSDFGHQCSSLSLRLIDRKPC